MKLQTSSRFEVLGADVNVDRSQHEVSLERDPAKNQEETETWCTKVTKKRSSRCKDTQLAQSMHLQFQESGHGQEMVNALDEGWMRVSNIMNSGACECEARPTTCPHIPFAESSASRAGQKHRTAAAMHFGRESGVYVLNTWKKDERQEEWILLGRRCDLMSLTSGKSNVETGV